MRVIYSDKNSQYKKLVEKDGSVPISNRNLQILPTEMLKIYDNIASPVYTEVFSKRNLNYKLPHSSRFSLPHVKSVYNETERLSYLGPIIWDIIPARLKEIQL